MGKSGDNVSISTLVITLSIHPIHFVAEIIDINAEIKVSATLYRDWFLCYSTAYFKE